MGRNRNFDLRYFHTVTDELTVECRRCKSHSDFHIYQMDEVAAATAATATARC